MSITFQINSNYKINKSDNISGKLLPKKANNLSAETKFEVKDSNLLKVYFLGNNTENKFSRNIIPKAKIENDGSLKSINQLYWNMLAEYVNKSGFKPSGKEPLKILSIGCGGFFESESIEKFFSSALSLDSQIKNTKLKAEVIGIDNNKKALLYGKNCFGDEYKTPQNIKIADATDLKKTFGDKKFDIVIFRHPELISALIHKPDNKAADYKELSKNLIQLEKDYGKSNITVTENESDPEFLEKAKKNICKDWHKMINEASDKLNNGGIIISSTYTEAEFHLMKGLLKENNFQVLTAEPNIYSIPYSTEPGNLYKHYSFDKYIIIAKKKQ